MAVKLSGHEGSVAALTSLRVVEKDGAARFEVYAKPRAKKSRIVGLRGEALEVSLAAPPVDGAANEELVRVLSDAVGVPKRQVTIVRGDTSPRKLVEIRPSAVVLAWLGRAGA